MFFTPPPTIHLQEPPAVTIWIHGTRASAFSPLRISKRLTQMEEEICLSPRGLHKITDLDKRYYHRTIAHILHTAHPHQFPFDSFYAFGWSGDLKSSARKKAAQELYSALKKLMNDYQTTYKKIPHITLITHSHGGNVALNLADVCRDNDLQIDKLILLACPVQKETEKYVTRSLFKTIYSIHSHADLTQVLDPQKFHPFDGVFSEALHQRSVNPLVHAFKESNQRPLFSERHFKPHHNLHQIEVRWETHYAWTEEDIAVFPHFKGIIKHTWQKLPRKRGLLHIEFFLPSFLKHLPIIINKAPISSKQNNESMISL